MHDLFNLLESRGEQVEFLILHPDDALIMERLNFIDFANSVVWGAEMKCGETIPHNSLVIGTFNINPKGITHKTYYHCYERI